MDSFSPQANSSSERLSSQFAAFEKSKQTTEALRADLSRYLIDAPDIQPVRSPNFNDRQRMDAIKELRDTIRYDSSPKNPNFEFTALELAFLFQLPEFSMSKIGTIQTFSKNLNDLVQLCLSRRNFKPDPDSSSHVGQKRAPESAPSPSTPPKKMKNIDGRSPDAVEKLNTPSPMQRQALSPSGASIRSTDSKKARNAKSVTEVKRRDNYECVITGARNPEAAHIMPYTINASPSSNKRLKSCLDVMRAFFSPRRYEQVTRLLTRSEGCMDIPANMICLAPGLHHMLDNADIALYWKGASPVQREPRDSESAISRAKSGRVSMKSIAQIPTQLKRSLSRRLSQPKMQIKPDSLDFEDRGDSHSVPGHDDPDRTRTKLGKQFFSDDSLWTVFIQVQFLRRSGKEVTERLSLESNFQARLSSEEKVYEHEKMKPSTTFHKFRLRSGRPLEHGYMFKLTVPYAQLDTMKIAFQISYLTTTTFAMAGGAGPIELSRFEDSPDSDIVILADDEAELDKLEPLPAPLYQFPQEIDHPPSPYSHQNRDDQDASPKKFVLRPRPETQRTTPPETPAKRITVIETEATTFEAEGLTSVQDEESTDLFA